MSSKKSHNLIDFKITQLEKKVDDQTTALARIYDLEKSNAIQDKQIELIYKKVEELEKKR